MPHTSTAPCISYDWLRHYRHTRYPKLCCSCRDIQHTKICMLHTSKCLDDHALDIWSWLLLWWSWFEAVRYKVCSNLVQSVYKYRKMYILLTEGLWLNNHRKKFLFVSSCIRVFLHYSFWKLTIEHLNSLHVRKINILEWHLLFSWYEF